MTRPALLNQNTGIALLGLSGVLLFCMSLILLFQNLPVVTQVQNKGTDAIASVHAAEVAGVSYCPTTEDFKASILSQIPRIIITAGKETQIVATKDIFSCVTITLSSPKEKSCGSFSCGISHDCLVQNLKKLARFSEEVDILTSAGGKTVYSRKNDWVVDYNVTADAVSKELSKAIVTSQSVVGKTSRSIIVQASLLVNTPGTDGTPAKRYIEIDGSRQLLFRWENGIYKTYIISGAYPQFNPVGVFTILNKAPDAWSTTALKWMPYWQAFTYDKKQKTMFGIHALVYWYPGYSKTGTQKIYEDEKHIGTPRSTGCIRLLEKDARELYLWSRVGDLVVIHN